VKDERAVDASNTEDIDTTGVHSKEARQKFAAMDGLVSNRWISLIRRSS
jgi:hypothetical protein